MKLSLNVIPEGPIDAIVRIVARAEELGYERCWVYDEGLATRDVHVVMSAIACATETIQIGPGITNPYTRHPAQTASAIASLDELSGGRAFLGIGAGGSLTLDPLGLARERPLAHVRDAIEVARALFDRPEVDLRGPVSTLRSATMSYGGRDIEIWLAGRGPRMLTLGGQLADGVMLDFIHKPSLGEVVQRVRAAGGRRLCYSTAVITEADDLEFVRPHMTYRLVDAPDPVKEAIGLGPADTARIRETMAQGLHAAAEHVRDEWVEPFVVTGYDGRWQQELGALCEEHDIEEFLLPLFDMADPIGYVERVAAAIG